MWYYSLLLSVFIFICFLLILLILMQQSKGAMGIGAIGGGSQVLFGGSGGQDLFQKTTWLLGLFFMVGSLGLALLKVQETKEVRLFSNRTTQNMPLKPAHK